MNILETIIEHKIEEVASDRKRKQESDLRKSELFKREVFSLKEFLMAKDRNGIIAEFKRKSPSKGIINDQADVKKITSAYAANGASALSVLTDSHFFGGSSRDLESARDQCIPILRKDFIIDEYQVTEAKAIGADAILLIAACLIPAQVITLARFARQLHLEVLLEIHSEAELEHICPETEIVGINNRDLKTFTVDLDRSARLAGMIPPGKIIVAESGINNIETIRYLKTVGFNGFLIGEHFMKEADPAIAFASFVNRLKKGTHESKSLRHDTTRSGEETG
jgi:indole-3-glycerol phosphate synthase